LGGARWLPARWSPPASSWIPGSRVSTAESTGQGAVIALLFQVARWLPAGVASQKFGPVAGDMARAALPYTQVPGKEPETPRRERLAVPGPRLDPGADSGVQRESGQGSRASGPRFRGP
jgi:hypothetical protein